MQAVDQARAEIPCVEACSALGLARATYYRSRARVSSKDPASQSETRPRKASPRALSVEERRSVLAVLRSQRFVDSAVPQVWATLLDEEHAPCSMRTMYRILDAHGEVRERRDQVRRPSYSKPELVATAPNQVWSWDITKLRGPRKWTYFHLYVLLDIFSRYAVGWMVARCESAALAAQLWAETVRKHGIRPGQLIGHSDRGAPMISKSLALLYADLGVAQSLSRPHVSDDNPYSEAQFKTLKYNPTYPDRFGCQEDARAWCASFFRWYNGEHRHSSLGWMTPADVHFGRAALIHEKRSRTLDAAYALHPERFVRRRPTPPPLPTAAWINPPVPTNTVAAAQ